MHLAMRIVPNGLRDILKIVAMLSGVVSRRLIPEIKFGEIGSIGRLVSMKTEPEMGRPLIIVKKEESRLSTFCE